MKCVSAIFCEIINTQIITKSTGKEDIIKDFVVMGFIIEIDNLFAKAILPQDQLDGIEDSTFRIRNFEFNKTASKIPFWQEVPYMLIQEYHIVFSFYLLPYWVIFISFVLNPTAKAKTT